jgi:hypothetical protein
MSTKTLNSVQSIVLPAAVSQPRTYSISPSPAFIPTEQSCPSAAEIDSFLEAENPLGCFRGVMWVMVFNVAVFLLGLMIWQSCKFFL